MKINTTAIRVRKVDINALCAPWAGSKAWAMAKPVCMAMMVPAVCMALIKSRIDTPINNPTSISKIINIANI